MALHEFSVYLDRVPEGDDLDAIFEAGLDDTTPETERGRGVLRVAREADTLAAAITSVAADVLAAGFHVTAIEDEDLVSLKTVAARAGRTYESLRLVANGSRGPAGFPVPLSGDGWSLYSWAAVTDWLRSNYGSTEDVDERTRTIAAADHLIRARILLADLTPLAGLTHA